MQKNKMQKTKEDVERSFIERNKNTTREKISDLISAGFTEDKAQHMVIQIIKNLPDALLPLSATCFQNKEWS